MKCVKEQLHWKIPLINVVGHRCILHQKCPYFLDLIKWFWKKPDPPISLNNKQEDRGFFWTIWSNLKSKDIFDAKYTYGLQHLLVGFFNEAAPSHTSFTDERSHLNKLLHFGKLWWPNSATNPKIFFIS